MRRVPRPVPAGLGARQAVARLGRFEHEAVTLRLVARLEAAQAAVATGRRTSAILGSLISGLRALRTGSQAFNPLSLPTQQRQLDAAIDRLLAGEATLLALSTDRISKADLEVKLATERTKEADTMASGRHPDLAVDAMNSRYDDLRAAASDLAGIPISHRDKRWKAVRDRLESESSKPVADLERTLTAGGYKKQAAQLKAVNDRFQADHQEFDKRLGVGGPAPQPSGAPNPQATPTK